MKNNLWEPTRTKFLVKNWTCCMSVSKGRCICSPNLVKDLGKQFNRSNYYIHFSSTIFRQKLSLATISPFSRMDLCFSAGIHFGLSFQTSTFLSNKAFIVIESIRIQFCLKTSNVSMISLGRFAFCIRFQCRYSGLASTSKSENY